MLDTDGFNQRFHVDHVSFFTFYGVASTRILLMTRHTGNSVIENYVDGIAVVVNGVHQGVYAGMEECRVTQYGNNLSLNAFSVEGFLRAVPHRNRCAHTDCSVHCIIRRAVCQSIAADVASNHHIFSLAQSIEQSSVRTSCTKCRRTLDDFFFVIRNLRQFFTVKRFSQHVGCHFTVCRECILAVACKSETLYKFFDIWIVFFYDINRFYLAAELFDHLCRQRECEA